jgi:ribosomal protein S18 acetylase RimI-like enzyme
LIDIRSLEGVSFETMTAAFNDAFSDYAVPANYPVEYLKALVTRRGYRPDLAVGAFDGDRLVGFVFNALNGNDAYNSGTGVVISHRRKGIARALMERSIETLPGNDYFLEVIETNERAAALYRDLGFVQTRRLQCWSYTSPNAAPIGGTPPSLDEIRSWCDMTPSWQNETHSIRRAIEPHVVVGNEDGGAVAFPSNGDVPQLAVRRDARRHGLGRRLLDAVCAQTKAPLRIMNIDDRDLGIERFLEAVGAKRTVSQLEMVLEL